MTGPSGCACALAVASVSLPGARGDQAVDAARTQVLAMIEERSGPFADVGTWASWQWDPAWPAPCLPQPDPAAGERDVPPAG